MNSSKLTVLSKRLSYLLRHSNFPVDSEGWARTDEVLLSLGVDFVTLTSIVNSDLKGRYSLMPNGSKIRANQGHSRQDVEISFEIRSPPSRLFHGTTGHAWSIIQNEGLKKMNRHAVHLSANSDKAFESASRWRHPSGPAMIMVLASTAAFDGTQFQVSENGVWLTEYLSPKYLILVP